MLRQAIRLMQKHDDFMNLIIWYRLDRIRAQLFNLSNWKQLPWNKRGNVNDHLKIRVAHMISLDSQKCLPFCFISESSESESASPTPTFSATESSSRFDKLSRKSSVKAIVVSTSQKLVAKHVLCKQYLKTSDKSFCCNWRFLTSPAFSNTWFRHTRSTKMHPSRPLSTNWKGGGNNLN